METKTAVGLVAWCVESSSTPTCGPRGPRQKVPRNLNTQILIRRCVLYNVHKMFVLAYNILAAQNKLILAFFPEV